MNIPNNYKPFIGIVFLLALVSLFNIPVLTTVWRYSFDDGTYSHAYLIPFIVLYLYFKLSGIGKLVFREKISLPSIIILLATGFALFVTSNAQISIGYWLSFLVFAIAGIFTVFRFNWYVLFPVSFLIFIFPLWGLLTNVLQNISVVAVTYMMSFTSIPTYVEAQYITIPAGVFEIADGCSGLRYIIVSLAISTLFIFLYINNIKKAIIFLSIAILGALITNWIRITALILIGDYTQMQSSLMEDHNTFGWYLYIPFMFLLFVWGNKLTTIDLLSTKPAEGVQRHLPTKISVLIMLLSFTVFSTSLKSLLSNEQPVPESALNRISIQPEVFHFTSSSISSVYIDKKVELITYFFNGSDLDGKPTYFDNKLIPYPWLVLDDDVINNWNINTVSNGRKKALIIYQYEINNEKIATARKFKIKRLIKAVSGQRETQLHWMFLACKTNCDSEKRQLETQVNFTEK